ncbi:hypothetical protein [Clostridium sp.]|uniref:hypothetical protein n=1 Tax=Clostridium sp. TaxID=1506 RepID=UPI00260515D8|nr:hypothetical protein [Clostridium sp.]
MQVKKVAKYNISSMKKSIAIFYSIFISICILIIILSKSSEGNVSSSGLELSSAIFIFIAGLNLFKENFYFAKSNNVSRKSYFLGTILSMIPIVGIMSIIDIAINRIYNLFVKCPTNYEMIFTDYRLYNFFEDNAWIQQNDIKILLNTFLFQAAVYLMLFTLGFIINMIYYKCNKFMKTVVSVTPVMLIILFNILAFNFPYESKKIGKFLLYIFGFDTRNPYMAITTFIILFIILAAIAYSLIRKMVIKER